MVVSSVLFYYFAELKIVEKRCRPPCVKCKNLYPSSYLNNSHLTSGYPSMLSANSEHRQILRFWPLPESACPLHLTQWHPSFSESQEFFPQLSQSRRMQLGTLARTCTRTDLITHAHTCAPHMNVVWFIDVLICNCGSRQLLLGI